MEYIHKECPLTRSIIVGNVGCLTRHATTIWERMYSRQSMHCNKQRFVVTLAVYDVAAALSRSSASLDRLKHPSSSPSPRRSRHVYSYIQRSVVIVAVEHRAEAVTRMAVYNGSSLLSPPPSKSPCQMAICSRNGSYNQGTRC